MTTLCVRDKELLGKVEDQEAFEGILTGQDVTIHTDYLNILYESASVKECGDGDKG